MNDYTCRAWWEPILYSPRGAEIGWLCLKCWLIHQYRNGSTELEDRTLDHEY